MFSSYTSSSHSSSSQTVAFYGCSSYVQTSTSTSTRNSPRSRPSRGPLFTPAPPRTTTPPQQQQHYARKPSYKMERKSLFGSIKDKLSRRNSDEEKKTRGAPPPSQHHPVHNPNEPPPAYSAHPTTAAAAAGSSSSSAVPVYELSTPAADLDSRYSFLSTFDTVFLIDDSGSMAGRSWREVSQALSAIAPICTAHDADGIDVRFLNAPHQPVFDNVRTASSVLEIFSLVRPGGGTPTGQRLHAILRDHVAAYRANPTTTKPLNVIVVTDGEASDDVESPLLVCAKHLDALDAPPWQVGVQFFQVGNEPGAAEMLRALDDELGVAARGAKKAGGEVRDMVDTVPFREASSSGAGPAGTLDADAILKVVLGAVNRRLDRKNVK